MNKWSSLCGRLLVQAKSGRHGSGEGVVFGGRPVLGRLVALCATLALLVLAPSAFATPSRSFETSFGSFSEPQTVTVDQSTGDVYVADVAAGTVSWFTAAGAPAEFSATKTNVLSGFVFEPGAAGLAIAPASSPGGTAGDIYVGSDLFDNVEIFDPNGSRIGELYGFNSPSGGFGGVCGVATDASTGALYVGDFNHHVWRYTPSTGTLGEGDYTGGIETPTIVCGVAAAAGSVYAGDTYEAGELRKYRASDFTMGTPTEPSSTLIDAKVTAVATDPSNGDVYADEGNKVSVFSASGASLYSFGSSTEFGSNSAGVGVKGSNGKAYVADAHAGGLQVDVFSSASNLPPVATTNAASTIHHTDAVLNGHLVPGTGAGAVADPVTDCHFDWGTTTAYTGGTVPCNEGNSFNAEADVTANLGNLTPGAPIHFRLDITGSAGGEATGEDQILILNPFPAVYGSQLAAFGSDGTSATIFTTPRGLGFDQASEKLYVVDSSPGIFGFDASSPPSYPPITGFTPLATAPTGGRPGVAVDNTGLSSAGDIYFASESTGPPGFGNGKVFGFDVTGASLGGNFPIDPKVTPGVQFNEICGDAVDSAGNLWVSDDADNEVLEYSSTGVYQASVKTSTEQPGGGPCPIAFDSANNLYIGKAGGSTWKYTAASGYTASTQFDSTERTLAIAVDPSTDAVYIAHKANVEEYSSQGTLLSEFADGIPNESLYGIAVDAADHDVYVSDIGNSTVRVFAPSGFLKIATVTPQSATAITGQSATLHALVDPETVPVSDCHFDYGPTTSYGQSVPCVPNPGSGSGDVAVSANLAGLDSGTIYHFRIVATNATPGGTTTGPDQTFASAGPKVHEASASQITTIEARLSALVNPEGKSTTYHFEYGPTIAYGSSTPESAPVGSNSVDHAAVKTITGLVPGTTYHFRIVATNADGVTDGSDTTFTTYPAPTGTVSLPDGRVYELVTNPDKGNSEVYEPRDEGEYSNIYTQLPFQASRDGTAMAYVGGPSEGGNEETGEFGGNQYVAKRSGGAGWAQSNISPVGFPSSVYQGFSSDLSVGFLDALDPLAPTAPGFGEEFPAHNYDVLYKANLSSGGAYVPVVTVKPPYRTRREFESFGLYHPTFPQTRPGNSTLRSGGAAVLGYAGASGDASHVLFEANDALTPEADGGSAAHYATENNLYEMANGELKLVNVLPDGSTKANATFGAPPTEANSRLSPDFSHVISHDGSRVFWTDLNTGHIYVRENGTTTTEISSAGKYWTATPDGSKVYYTNGDLYEYDVASATTTDLTPGVTVEGVIGTSEDGSYVYYVTEGLELSLWHDGVTTAIKALSANDRDVQQPYAFENAGDWQPGDANRVAQVSPNGHGLAFMTASASSPEDFRLDVYSADSGQVYCASCGTQGTRGYVPLTYSNTYLRRWISADGSRVFFDSGRGLVPRDTNGRIDAYEWERPGSGTCKAASTGCIYLLSGGTSNAESYFADASASGDDVFIVTRAKLLSQDDNELYDLYDVRVDGVKPVVAPQCTGTGCQGVPGAPPIFATPSSVTFEGTGNFAALTPVVKAKPKPKPKAKKKPKPKPRPKHKKVHGKAKKGSKASRGRAGNARNHGLSSGKGGRS